MNIPPVVLLVANVLPGPGGCQSYWAEVKVRGACFHSVNFHPRVAGPRRNMDFSIIIPLEFHRGLSGRCIEGWSRCQTYPRDRFQIIVVAPDTCSDRELQDIRALLQPQDSLLTRPHHHDMPLMADGAREARGANLFFTEAHCLPNPETLEQAAAVLLEEPGWAGFSCRSIPITHNLLSEIEAEMYDAHIKENMTRHPWLKVLDQCLVLRREAYLSCGGIEPEYGHFAEWVIAARLHQSRNVIGYHTTPAIRHYYIGKLADLEEFTEDFSRGEMRFQTRGMRNDCRGLFPLPHELAVGRARCPGCAAALCGMLLRDLGQRLAGPGRLAAIRGWDWKGYARWKESVVSWRAQRLGLRAAIFFLRQLVRLNLLFKNKVRARAAFLNLIAARVRSGRLGYVIEELHRDEHPGKHGFCGKSESFSEG